MIKEEGLQPCFARHARLAAATRAACVALGCALFAPDAPSPTVTAVRGPETQSGGFDTGKLVKHLRDKYGVSITGGQDAVKGKIFRVAHLGYFDTFDILTSVSRHRDGARRPRREDFARLRNRRRASGVTGRHLALQKSPDGSLATLPTISFVEDPEIAGLLPPAPSELSPGTVVGEYVVERKLGDGGMASVYGATHPLIGKKAAIKVMSPSLSADAGAVARFALEARAVNAIGHPNIVDVFSFGRLPDGRSYFVMEWLPGETLYDRMWKQHGPLPLNDVVNVLDQICDALEATHDKGIIHRDLKPANVFLCTVRGRPDLVKLLDFGVAKLSHHDSSPHWTSAGCVVGTPEYISPEQARGKDVDGCTDLYSLGVMAYEMVLGRQPFISDNPADAIQMHLCAKPPRPSVLWKRIPPPLERLLLKLLEKDPAARASLAEVRQALATLRPMVTQALDRIDDAPLAPLPPPRKRHAFRLAIVAASFFAIAIAGYRPSRSSEQQAARAAPPATAPMATKERTRATDPTASPPTAPAVVAAPASDAPAPAHPATHRARRSRRDANYLLDPFAH